MELRARSRQQLRRAAMTAALGALLVPATAGAATKSPVITKVSPKSVSVGENLTIYGKSFRKGKAKNRVLFKGAGGKTLFVKAGLSTARKLTLAVPKSLEKYMTVRDGKPVATRFRLRVLSVKLSKAYTSVGRSPVVGPEQPKTDDGGGGIALDPNADADGDGLTNGFESGVLTTDPKKADTDGDGVTDGFEYASAVDLNNDDYRNPTSALPYPGKRPYPNALDAADANTDFDGDGLNLNEEYALWKFTIANGGSASLSSLSYSDGLKYSVYGRDAQGRRIPALAAAGYDKHAVFLARVAAAGYGTVTLPDDPTHSWGLLDFDRLGGTTVAEDAYLDRSGNGWLSDDERDEDGDGLNNWVETHGWGALDYWKARYDRETPFRIAYAGTNLVDPDSDGDDLADGIDDQDHDDYPNVVEQSRINITWSHGHGFDAKDLAVASANASPSYGRVNPFNPCLPNTDSRTCPTYIPFAGGWAPFDGPPWVSTGSDPNYLVLQ
jgi:IPT/TIG domain